MSIKTIICWHAAVEPAYRKLFSEMAALGVDVSLITPEQWREGGRNQAYLPGLSDNYKTIALKTVFKNHVRAFFYPNVVKIAGELRKAEIIYIMEEPFSLAAYQFIRLKRLVGSQAKVILFSFENIDIPQRFPYSKFQEFNLNQADALVSVPGEGVGLWRKRGFKGKIYHLPIGVDDEIFHRGGNVPESMIGAAAGDRFKIGYVGRIVREKGLETLLCALEILKKRKRSCVLSLIGNGDYKSGLLKKAEEKGVTVCFLDAVNPRELPAFYSHINALVLPSETTAFWKEQFGRVIVEAMACETPVIGSSSGEIPQVIGDAGLIFPEGDSKSLADLLERLILDRDLCRQLGEKGKKRALEQFTWKAVARKLTDMFSELLAA
ncbi:MAG: glycosyltransferase [bacterium]